MSGPNGAVHSDHFEPLTATLEKHKQMIAEVQALVDQPLDQVFVQDPTLTYRFLKGWKYDVSKTVARINTAQRYRREHDLTGIRSKAVHLTQQQFPHAERVLKYWPHIILHGYDRRGQPLSIERLGHSNPTILCQAVTLPELMLYHHYHMENKGALFSSLSVERDVVVRACKIMDLQGLGKQHLTSKGIQYFTTVITASQDNYPETMGSLFIINAPWIFTVAWRIVRPLLNDNTLEKIHILGSDYSAQLKQYIDPKHIPKEFGGDCDCGGRGCVPLYNPEDDMTKLHVKAGSRSAHSMPVPPTARPKRLTYEFRMHSHDIGFSISMTRLDGKTDVLVPNARRGNGEVVSDALTVDGEGELHMVFDNGYSRFTGKTLWYRVDLREMEDDELEADKEIAEEEKRSPRGAAAEANLTSSAPQ